MAATDDGWTRELEGIEPAFFDFIQKGILRIRYWLVLNAKEPLKETDIKEALTQLFRL